MKPILTSAQQAFLKGLKLQNTDNRALQIIVAAFDARNNYCTTQRLEEVIDKVAG